ncbi:MAG: hypothetical protein LBN02_01790 [Oscillospiraceae bacterium]|jgi:hypothetical protein|nr:hypothetical protein [Oscillospiraceae bacterium]
MKAYTAEQERADILRKIIAAANADGVITDERHAANIDDADWKMHHLTKDLIFEGAAHFNAYDETPENVIFLAYCRKYAPHHVGRYINDIQPLAAMVDYATTQGVEDWEAVQAAGRRAARETPSKNDRRYLI